MTDCWKDPIVEETRAYGLRLAQETGNDIHQYFEHLRRAQGRYQDRVVSRIGEEHPVSGKQSPAPTA